ncbi:MAG: hypothetical protein KAS18_09735 [Calditrichia bacterium]|nr:hypothetical protein [Calditrichia bacterium]
MQFYIIVLFLSITVIFSGCSSNTVEPIQIESEETIRISGALNKSFYSNDTQYDCQGTIKSWDIGTTLILSIRAKSNTGSGDEQISLNLYIPLDSDEYPVTGKYYSHLLADNFSGVSYKNQWSQNSFSKYRFETGLARIIIEESDNNHLIGKFSLSAQQSYGQRTLNGEVENIMLINDGKLTVSGKINIMLDS